MSGSRLFGLVVRTLDFYPDRPCSISTIGGKVFQLCFIPLLRLSYRKMGFRPSLGFTLPKMASSLKTGRLRHSTPTFDNLPWQVSHSLYVYIQSLTTALGSRLFGSVVRELDFYPGRQGSNPTIGERLFQLCFIPLLRLSCRKTTKIFPFRRPL